MEKERHKWSKKLKEIYLENVMSYISPKCNGTISFVYLKCGGRIFTIFGRSDFNVFSYKKWTLERLRDTIIKNIFWSCMEATQKEIFDSTSKPLYGHVKYFKTWFMNFRGHYYGQIKPWLYFLHRRLKKLAFIRRV